MRTFEVRLQTSIGDNINDAERAILDALKGIDSAAQVNWVSTIHPRGVERHCEPAPKGYRILAIESQYYGSHEEYGEGDTVSYYAIPKGAKVPRIRLSHGHYSSDQEGLSRLPEGTLEWFGEEVEGKWVHKWIPFVFKP